MLQLCLVLTACGGSEGDDLDKFMRDAGQDMRAKIPPLPEVQPYMPFLYNADGALNDPFRGRKTLNIGKGVLQPDTSRPKQPLEAYPLESLQYVGSISRARLKYALIRTPDGTIQQVRTGQYMGQSFGVVTDINDAGISIKEIIQDELTGDWQERTTSISLQE